MNIGQQLGELLLRIDTLEECLGLCRCRKVKAALRAAAATTIPTPPPPAPAPIAPPPAAPAVQCVTIEQQKVRIKKTGYIGSGKKILEMLDEAGNRPAKHFVNAMPGLTIQTIYIALRRLEEKKLITRAGDRGSYRYSKTRAPA